MTSTKTPSMMQAWQYHNVSGSIENDLKISSSVPVPTPKNDEHLVRILATAINPLDYKPVEAPFAGRFLVKRPAIPGFDIAGRIVKPAAGSPLKPGQLVFGAATSNIFAAGGLAEFVASPASNVAAVPEGITTMDAASIPLSAWTAWQAIVPYIMPGSRIFLNGGSGGVGVIVIQIAKAKGAHVTTSCSTTNVELCQSLGADNVVDYRKGPVVDQLKSLAKVNVPFDHVVDLVGNDYSLYWRCHEYTTPSAKFIEVAGKPDLGFLGFMLRARLLPGFLGGGKRKLEVLVTQIKADELEQIGKMMHEGKINAVIEQTFGFEEVVEAFRKSKTGRSKGKIMVENTRTCLE